MDDSLTQDVPPLTDEGNTSTSINIIESETIDVASGNDDYDDNNNEVSVIERKLDSSVRVAVRVRPFLHFEQGYDNCMDVMKSNSNDTHSTVIRVGGQESGPRFTFDQVFDQITNQDELFQTAVSPLVTCCLEGYNATILAYGQTGSGKTHTMMGPSPTNLAGTRKRRRDDNNRNNKQKDQNNNIDDDMKDIDTTNDDTDKRYDDDDRDDAAAGIIPRVFQSIFTSLEEMKMESTNTNTNLFEYQVSIQFLELYGEEIRDLLTGHNRDSTKLTIRDLGTDEPEVVGATQQAVSTAEEALLLLSHGMLRRVTGATSMNESSSRSHAIISVLVEQQRTIHIPNSENSNSNFDKNVDSIDNSVNSETNHVQVMHSRFNLVDLAGSERQKRTQAEGKRLKEGIDINKGLLVLGNVISALGDPKKRGKTFVPYRDSKLTRLLKGSLGGNHRTLMIACVSPASSNMEESLNCLRYANRAKNIQNNAVVNVDGNSRLVQDLQMHVQILASDLIRILNTNQDAKTSYPKQTLEVMASGGKAGLPITSPGGLLVPGTPSSGLSGRANHSCSNLDTERKVCELEIELNKTHELLRESRLNHDAAEEQLYIVKAQKELSDLQLSVLKDTSNTRGFNHRSDSLQDAYLAKMTSYESDIGKLKHELEESQTKLQRMKWALNKTVTWATPVNDDEDQLQFINDATKQLNDERQQLFDMQAVLNGQDENQENDQLDRIDEEQLQEEAELQNLTKKYLQSSDRDDYDDFIDENTAESTNVVSTTPDRKIHKSLREVGGSNTSTTPRPSSTSQRERKVEADLSELSRSIAAKESLIEQLKVSQEKYASMRDFYEDRLRQMEVILSEKERERETLLRDLKRSKEVGHVGTKEIEEKIGQKEKHIADLRKKQQELMKLTAVSSRNDLEINRLHDDVQNMKRLKVDLQKKLAEEKKAHAKQMKDMQKNVFIKDKELSKAKRISSQREIEAKRANQVAKQRLDELAQLRTKYKDSEKKLRMASLKKGVLAKAGIDPVIIGRRENGLSPGSSPDREQILLSRRHGNANEHSSPGSTSVDSLRTYFDQKVAGIARKEAIVDKLAHEWEEHFELSSRKQELTAQKSNEDDAEELDEAHQALLIQIQFKEERIRKLASRLGKAEEPPDENLNVNKFKSESFLFGKEFHSICRGSKADKSHVTAARVLFGMIVRERRRVGALARTASSLDERVLVAERAAELSEAALRSYVEEQRHEIAALTQNQQEHILSLMDMVKEDSAQLPGVGNADDLAHSEEVFQRKLLVLANERVNLMEKQIAEMQLQLTESNSYREKLEDVKESLNEKQQEYEDVHTELIELRLALRHIREVLRTSSPSEIVSDDRNSFNSLLLDIVRGALDPSRTDDSFGPTDATPPRSNLTPRSKNSVRKGGSSFRFGSHGKQDINAILSDSDGDNDAIEDTPDWANDIMADLALIAEGKLPPSMENSAAVIEGVSQFEKHFQDQSNNASSDDKGSSVFDRLSDPKQFTGTQKVRKTYKSSLPVAYPNSTQKANSGGTSKVVRRRDDKKPAPAINDTIPGSNVSQDGHQSVFDRLVSPSHYTGTQKEKFIESKYKRERTAEQVADRVLDGLLYTKESNIRTFSDSNLPDQHATVPSRHHTVYTEYAKQDVFERLQKTTTQAFAVKTHHNITSSVDGHSQDESHRWHAHDTGILPSISEQNHRAATETTSSKHESPPSHEPSSATEKNPHSDYMRQDVFERLQRTTTEAYAKKTNTRFNNNDNDNMH